ncbi:hypothetical protein LSH36_269g05058 [Paralvinella palmiformis]|uniref:Pulmonary surfactant-associated protein B n=1 Tax=Paralvinella palmiformis TaxID=53620 RepID=A0AAD9N4W8_9ANNE|nr:hypothetical protein LSH36_269g05058 [Paralvinella palmiformis]
MKYLFIFAVTLALANADDRCAWGESYWCASLQNAKLCGAFEHCLTTVWKNQKLEQDAGTICTYCENIITDVKSLITDKQAWNKVQKFMESACSIIPDAEVATKCKQMVDNYLPELLAMLEKNIDPQMICSLLGMCNGVKDLVQHHPINSLHRVALIKVPSWQADPICADCKKLMQDIKNDFVKSEKQIEQLLEDNLCKKLQRVDR